MNNMSNDYHISKWGSLQRDEFHHWLQVSKGVDIDVFRNGNIPSPRNPNLANLKVLKGTKHPERSTTNCENQMVDKELLDRMGNDSLSGLYFEGFLVSSAEQEKVAFQIERILKPGGFFALTAIIPFKKPVKISRSTIKDGWGSLTVLEKLKKNFKTFGLKLEVVKEQPTILSNSIWLDIYEEMTHDHTRWSDETREKLGALKPSQQAGWISARYDYITVSLAGAKTMGSRAKARLVNKATIPSLKDQMLPTIKI